MVIANIDGQNLTDPAFSDIWREIDRRGLPVLLHPGTPQGVREMNLDEYGLVPPVGFALDTTLAVSRMIFDGFFDRYPNIRLIAAHGGGALPYLAARLDRCHEMIPACAEVISERPSEYLRHIHTTPSFTHRARLRFVWRLQGPRTGCFTARIIRTT